MAVRKHSRQRDALLNALADRTDHPSAETLYQELREVEPKISLGTVYRNLALLAENGDILKLTGGDDKSHYDGNIKPHDHFWCRSCGKLTDIFHEDFEMTFKNFNGRIESHQTLYTGICDECIKAE